MKQKYVLSRDMEKGLLSIREFSELSKGSFTLVCEESYELEAIENAISQGKNELIKAIRTPNFYPVSEYAQKIADSLIELFEVKDRDMSREPIELLFDDADMFAEENNEDKEVPDEDVDIDNLLDAPEDDEV